VVLDAQDHQALEQALDVRHVRKRERDLEVLQLVPAEHGPNEHRGVRGVAEFGRLGIVEEQVV
jgi:hypothetical protein